MTFPPLLPGWVERLDRIAGPFSLTRCIAIAIAITSLITAGTASLQENASTNGAAAARNMQRYAVITASDRAAGQARVNYDYHAAYKQWESLNFQALQAEITGELDRADRLKAQRDAIEPLTPLLSDRYRSDFTQLFPGYFIGTPDRFSYESDLYVRSTAETGERYSLAARQQSEWSAKGTKFVRQLAFLGVALFLLGLSATLPRRAYQRGFLALGIAVASVASAQVVANIRNPIPSVSEAALQRYADAEALVHKSLDDPAATDEAISAYSDAIRLQPGYAHAYLARADAVATRSGRTPEDTRRNQEAALAGYKRAIDSAGDDLTTAREARTASARLLYNLGRFAESEAMARRVLQDDPDQLAVRFQLMLALLARDAPDASEELGRGLATARREVNASYARGAPVSPLVWFELERVTQRLSGLADRIDGLPSSNAPPLEALAAGRERIRTNAVTFFTRVKDETIALERRPPEQPGAPASVRAGAPVFSLRSSPDRPETSFPYRTQTILVGFSHEGLRPGQRLTMKVYAGTVFEATELRREQRHAGDATGISRFEIAYQGTRNLPPGDYRVEIYVENHLVANGAFNIDAGTPSR